MVSDVANRKEVAGVAQGNANRGLGYADETQVEVIAQQGDLVRVERTLGLAWAAASPFHHEVFFQH